MLVLWNLSLLVAPLITDYTGFIIYIMSEREIILRDSISRLPVMVLGSFALTRRLLTFLKGSLF